MSKKNKKLNPEEYADEIAKQVTAELLKLFLAEKREKGVAFKDMAVQRFLTCLMASLIYNDLTDLPEGATDEELLEYSKEAYAANKEIIANSVSDAFKASMRSYSGKEVDYFCQIQQIAVDANKLPC